MAEDSQKREARLYFQSPLLFPTLKVGAVCGASGLLVGGAAGIIRSSTPGLFALASGIQWTLLGSTYYVSREAILRAWLITPSSPPQDRVLPSALAGAVTGGTVGGLIRGRTNIIPGIIMFSLFGFAGQHTYNFLDSRHSTTIVNSPGLSSPQSKSTAHPAALDEQNGNQQQALWKRVLNSNFSPMKVLSDQQYKDLLKEKLVRVDAEIALVDEQIEKARMKERSKAQDVQKDIEKDGG